MKFSYPELSGKYLPIIPIKLKTKTGQWIEFDGFVDSGATYSIFHADVAEILGLSLKKAKKEFVKIGDGSFISVYFYNVTIKVAEKEFTAKIGFSENLGIGFNIIGRKDIFENFIVCFDEKERSVEFTSK